MSDNPSLPDRVELVVDELAGRMVSAFVAAVPAYRTLPREQLDGEIRAICVANLRLLMRCLRQGRGPDRQELAEPRASAARRAEERVPLDQVLTAYMTGATIGWDALVREARTDEQSELLHHAAVILTYLREVTAVVSNAYTEEQEALVSQERDARRELTEALLTSGNAPAALADRAGITPSPTYRAVALRFAATADEVDPGVSSTVAGRRKVRRVVSALEALTGGPVLTLLDANGGAAVLHLADPAAAHAALTEAVGGEVWLSISEEVGPPALPTAWRQVRDVRRLTAVLRRPAGVWTVEDVLLERTLSADPVAAGRLAAILDPLEEREDLMATVEAWFDHDFDRRETAAHLSIHPNTLDYRLRRVSEVVGRDLATAAGTQLVGAALLARRLGGEAGL